MFPFSLIHCLVFLAIANVLHGEIPEAGVSLFTEEQRAAWRAGGTALTESSFEDHVLQLDFHLQSGASASLMIHDRWELRLTDAESDDHGLSILAPAGEWQHLDIAVKALGPHSAEISTWLNGQAVHQRTILERDASKALYVATADESARCSMEGDFTAVTRFRTESNGPLFSRVALEGDHRPNDKVLFIRDHCLDYDIGWVGVIGGQTEVTDNAWHTAAVRTRDGVAALFIDGKKEAEKAFISADSKDSVLKLGASAPNFPADRQWNGELASFHFYNEALTDQELELTLTSEPVERVKPVFEWTSEQKAKATSDSIGGPLRITANGVDFGPIQARPLSEVDHASILRAWDARALERGARLYQGICFTCHGNLTQPGTLPTSRPFWKDPFKNGKDPLSLFHTLQKGYNQMPPQPWLTATQAYDVIYYIRETFVKPNNPSQYTEVDAAYLQSLPKGLGTESPLTKAQEDYAKGPAYLRMNFGPMLNWTYQVAENNIAYKGIAIRLDEGDGGISKGKAWMLYDHDTMRVAAAWSGNEFIDWKGIAFDQSHGTHASIVGDRAFVNPVGPGWAHPQSGTWEDPRFRGRDGKPYGPLPKDWVRFKGQYLNGQRVVVHYAVGEADVLESPSWVDTGSHPVFARTLNIGKSSHDLLMRVAPVTGLSTMLLSEGGATLSEQDGFHLLTVPSQATPIRLKVLMSRTDPQGLYISSLLAGPPEDLQQHLKGGPRRWMESVTSMGKMGGNDAPFEVDEIAYPENNPWHSWMRIGGFDFMPDNDRAAVATWLGDVWIVDGLKGDFHTHHWRRICTGLFQPLGVKVVDGTIVVTCRDQLAKLHDLNGDEEIDYIECFNNDHQVTEHFHEFAMGLQTDAEGNFYYAKSARHALPALVAHHGTLLRVSKDGSHTDILATGFRAANGVCLNPDGTFIVTDQEGHWNPKNRINYVKEGGFYGNMYGYHSVTDASDSAMEQPLCWITNAFDRSPGELVWVPEKAAWGPLNGHLLNLSYGMGRIFLVPHEKINGQAQGGMVSLGLDFPTGIMRGRFHPDNGQLYAAGMFAWAGNKSQDGGFYRIRATGKASYLPTELRAVQDGLELTFSEPLDPVTAREASNYAIKVWGLKRTKQYGSKHYNEHSLTVSAARLASDGRTVYLSLPGVQPTWCMEIRATLKGADGEVFERIIHNTIHEFGKQAP